MGQQASERKKGGKCAPLCQLMVLVIFSQIMSSVECPAGSPIPTLFRKKRERECDRRKKRKENYSLLKLLSIFCRRWIFPSSHSLAHCALFSCYFRSLLFTHDSGEEWEHQSKSTTSFFSSSPFTLPSSLFLLLL